MKPPQTNPVHQSVFLAFLGFFLWCIGDASVRGLNALPLPIVVFGCAAPAVIIMLLFAKQMGGMQETFRRPKLKLRMARGALLAGSNFCAVTAFTHLDMATAYAIIFLTPLMAKILSVFLMKEKIPLRSWLISLLGFAGVLVILRPGMVPMNIGAIAALGLTCFFSLGYVLSAYIGEENQTRLSMSLFQYTFVTLCSAPFAFASAEDINITLQDLSLMTLCGTLAVIGAVLVTTAFARAPAAIVAPVHYSQMIWGVLFGAVFFQEFPDIFTVIGGSIIIIAGLLLIRFSPKGMT